mgnify:CR=1 FL=1|jgi:hypothetical protein
MDHTHYACIIQVATQMKGQVNGNGRWLYLF